MALKSNNQTSIRYHNIFDFKLTKEEINKWQYKREKPSITGITSIKSKNRIEREKHSQKKLKIANRAATLISKIPSVKFVGITGSLAMMNSNRDSDIDLMIITESNTLWLTRLLILLILLILRIPFRRAGKRDEKNRLCLNMWLDETDFVWDKKDRNIYTAHEIAQIVPLVNKDKTYEKFIYLNRWILNYWPNSVAIQSTRYTVQRQQNLSTKYYVLSTIVERLAYKIQYWYMSKKITREVITPTRAIFHPNDWGKVVIKKLN